LESTSTKLLIVYTLSKKNNFLYLSKNIFYTFFIFIPTPQQLLFEDHWNAS